MRRRRRRWRGSRRRRRRSRKRRSRRRRWRRKRRRRRSWNLAGAVAGAGAEKFKNGRLRQPCNTRELQELQYTEIVKGDYQNRL